MELSVIVIWNPSRASILSPLKGNNILLFVLSSVLSCYYVMCAIQLRSHSWFSIRIMSPYLKHFVTYSNVIIALYCYNTLSLFNADVTLLLRVPSAANSNRDKRYVRASFDASFRVQLGTFTTIARCT